MRLKTDFRNRLIALDNSIQRVLINDSLGYVKLGDLFPRLASVFRFLWCNSDLNILKK